MLYEQYFHLNANRKYDHRKLTLGNLQLIPVVFNVLIVLWGEPQASSSLYDIIFHGAKAIFEQFKQFARS